MNIGLVNSINKNILIFNIKEIKNLKINELDFAFNDLINEDEVIANALSDIKKYDIDTYNHSIRVAMFAALIGNALSFDQFSIQNLIKAALVHDVGKIKIPLSLLNYRGKYDDLQRTQIKKHPQYGVEYFKGQNISQDILDVVLQHHESCDGSGYPYCLKYENINKYSRIVSVCDIFEAYTAHRVYHQERTVKEGIDYLTYLMQQGKIDKNYTKLFIKLINE